MELKDTVKLMKSKEYIDRFKAEFYQLAKRHESLGKMLQKYKDGKLDFKPVCSYEILYQQYVFMGLYLDVLYLRAGLEQITLYSEVVDK